MALKIMKIESSAKISTLPKSSISVSSLAEIPNYPSISHLILILLAICRSIVFSTKIKITFFPCFLSLRISFKSKILRKTARYSSTIIGIQSREFMFRVLKIEVKERGCDEP